MDFISQTQLRLAETIQVLISSLQTSTRGTGRPDVAAHSDEMTGPDPSNEPSLEIQASTHPQNTGPRHPASCDSSSSVAGGQDVALHDVEMPRLDPSIAFLEIATSITAFQDALKSLRGERGLPLSFKVHSIEEFRDVLMIIAERSRQRKQSFGVVRFIQRFFGI